MPWVSYIIVSVQDGKAERTRLGQLNEERQFEEESIEINNIKQEANS